MLNRALSPIGRTLGSALTGSDTRGSRRRSPGSGDSAARGVYFLPRPGAETGKERTRGSDLRYLPRVSRKVSPPREHSQARLRHVPRGPGRRLRPERTRPGSQGGQRRRARLRRLPRQRPRTAVPQLGSFSQRRPGYLRDVPQRGGGAIREERTRTSGGARSQRGPAVHRLPRRTQNHQTQQRSLAGERGAHPGNLRKLPRRCPPDAQVRAAVGPHGELRLLLPRPGGQGRVADGGQLRELSRRAQHSAVIGSEVHHQPQEPAADLRQMPSGRRHALRDQPGTPCGGREGAAAARLGCGSSTCSSSR